MLKIYKSSAGSGKTYTLVKEYLRLAFAHPVKYRNILAITFTNKAAAEMKSRILEALDGISNNEKDYVSLANELCELTGKSHIKLKHEAGLILRSMLHNYADISVSTIDSFVHRIVRSFAYDLHIPTNFDIEMDSKKLLHDAVQLLLDRLSEGDVQVTQAVLEFAETKIEDGKSWSIDKEIQKLGNELFVDEALPYIKKLSFVELDKMREAKSALHAQKQSFEREIFDQGKKAFSLILDNGLTAKDFYQGTKGLFGYFNRYAEEVFPKESKGNTYVKACMVENNWGKKDSVDENLKERLRDYYNRIVALLDNEGKDYYLADLLLKNFYSFILLADLQKLMDEIKRENNILHIGDFQHKVYEIVKEQDAPVIYERIGEKYDNILIDEFQDTSVMQWRNLLPLIENSQFKNEDSLIVGDGKQAIYRFRGGEVEQFSALPKIYGSESDELVRQRETAIKNYGTSVELLERNYRSRKEIIDFNNAFYHTMSELPDLKNKAIYLDHFQEPGKDKQGGFVSIEFLHSDNDAGLMLQDVRCNRVEEIISDVLQRGYQWKDIAVLTRNNLNASAIASFLVKKGVRVISPESLLINQSQKVQLLLSVFNYLNRKENHIARAEMLYYSQMLRHQVTHFEQIMFNSTSSQFESDFRVATQIDFDSSSLLTGRLPDLTQQLIHVFKLDDEDPFLQFFLDEIILYSFRYGNSIGDFLTWWDGVKHKKSIIYPENMDAVRIMTIHKSKGLQFPVVILADATEKKKMTKNFFWIPLSKPYLPQLHIGLLPRTELIMETEFASVYQREDEQSFLDLLNLLYVGTTRAEDALYILSEELLKEPDENNSVTALLIYFLKIQQQWEGFQQYVFGEFDYRSDASKREKKKSELYQRTLTSSANLLASAIKVKTRTNLLWSENVNQKIDDGNLLHEALKQIRYEGDEQVVVSKMKAEGLLQDTALEVMLAKLKEVVYHPAMNNYFKKEMRVITERPLLKKGDKVKIPDRVVLQNGSAVVIDYKTGKELQSHQIQLKEYAACLEEAGIPVKEKILFYTTDIKKEVVI